MNRKDYILIASVLNREWNSTADLDMAGRDAIGVVIAGLTSALLNDNDRFDAVKFAQACTRVAS